jgi:hypothetical protein
MTQAYRICAVLGVAAALLTSTACANPRAVTKMTGTVDQVKLVYQSRTNAGIIKCGRAADGSLENCKELPVVFLPKSGVPK